MYMCVQVILSFKLIWLLHIVTYIWLGGIQIQ